jgi:Ca2+/Na+ antiporter
MEISLGRIVTMLSLLCFPFLASACGMGMISISDGELAVLGLIVLAGFLAGYLPYVIFSVKLSKQAMTTEGTKTSTKVWASIFTLINTVVFVSCLTVVLEINPLVVIGDCLLWGVPFFFYIKGMVTHPPSQSDMLDA